MNIYLYALFLALCGLNGLSLAHFTSPGAIKHWQFWVLLLAPTLGYVLGREI